MANFKNRTQSTNKNTQDLVGAQFYLVDGSVTATPVVIEPTTVGCRLIRVVNSTKGLGLNIRSGSRVIGTIGTSVAEGSFTYGVYCENGIQVDVSGSGGNATFIFATQ